jgi:hypothetical protein
MAEFLDEFAGQLGTNTGVAFSRLSSVFDKVKYETWFSNEEFDPMAILTVLVRIGPGHTREQVDQFLADRVQAIGLQKPETVVREGITYSRMSLPPPKPRDYALYEPAYLVTADTVILTSNEDYLHQIIDVMAGRAGNVADSPAFRAVTGGLPTEATFALYVNARILREYYWDHRNLWVMNSRSSDAHAMRFRAERQKHYARGGKPLSQDDLSRVDAEVDAEVARYRTEEYPRFVAEYRGIVDRWSRFRAGALVMAARGGTIDGGISLLFTAPESLVGP